MKHTSPRTLAMAAVALVFMLQVLPSSSRPRSISRCTENVEVEIVPDKRVYAKGATAHVEFLVTNRGDVPVYLFKSIRQCSSPLGWLSLQIRSPQDALVPGFECAADYVTERIRMAKELSDSRYGVQLEKDEVYGKWQEYKLPQEKGVYRLQGEIGQVGYLTEDQEKELSDEHIRILRHTCQSPEVTIEVK